MYYAGESLLEQAVSLHEIELRMEIGNCARSKIGSIDIFLLLTLSLIELSTEDFLETKGLKSIVFT